MKLAILAVLLLTTPPIETTESPVVLVEVATALATQEGSSIVVLRSKEPPIRYMPIWIGGIEAMNIQLRMQRQQPPRPFTLNLLENVMKSADIKIEKVVVDSLVNGTFTGFLVLHQGKRTWKVDARPSDAIGLAVGASVPIWVNQKVFQKTSVLIEELQKEDNKAQENLEESL